MSIYGNPVLLGGGGGGSANILSGTYNPSPAAGRNGSIFLQYYTLEDSGEGWFAKPGYICASAGDMGTINGRHYYKTDSNPAIVIFCKNGDYMQPHLASTIASACSYRADSGGPWNYDHTYTIDGTVWYFFSGYHGFLNPTVVTDYPVVTSETFDFDTQANAERFLEIAGVSTVQQSLIKSAYAKVSGAWQDLIGTDIDDIVLGGESYYYNEHLFSDMPYTAWVEDGSMCSVTVDSALKKVSFGYTSGVYIGQRFGWQGIFYPGAAASLHYKITTGATSYDQSLRFAPGIGILPYTLLASAVINHGEYGAVTNVGSFLKYAYTTQRNDTVEGSFDLRDISTPYILIVFGAGWNAEFSEITFA